MSSLEELKKQCDEKGIVYHHKAGVKKLSELLGLPEPETIKPEPISPEAEKTIAALRENATIVSAMGTNRANLRPMARYERQERSRRDEVEIFLSTGQHVRTYSLDIHGKDYRELAKSFCEGQNRKMFL